MNREKVRTVQLCQLDLALEVKRICQKHNIKYFIVDGTALGAAKYGGFIPWDDDLDIGMLKEDYDKFTELCKTELNCEYFLQNYNSDLEYCNCFSQLKIKNTQYSQKTYINTNIKDGIFIDIHPFIPMPDDKIKRYFLCLYLHYLKISLLAKSGCKGFKNPLIHIIRFFNRFKSREKIISRIEYIIEKIAKPNQTIALKVFGRNAYKDYIYINNINKLEDINFEKHLFKIMPDYDRMLTLVYGDYMNTLPKGNVENRHEIQKIDFGSYNIKNKLATEESYNGKRS